MLPVDRGASRAGRPGDPRRVERPRRTGLRDAVAAGARSAVTFSSLFEEEPPADGPALPERLGAIARSAGIAMCGGNGMGFLNLDTGLRATGFATPDDMRADR